MAYSKAEASGGAYDLKVPRVSEAGTQQFVHRAITILVADTHDVDYGARDGFGSLALCIDHGSNGDMDETLTLDNQLSRICLPLILKES